MNRLVKPSKPEFIERIATIGINGLACKNEDENNNMRTVVFHIHSFTSSRQKNVSSWSKSMKSDELVR